MRKQLRSVHFLWFIAALLVLQQVQAQNSSPYWSLAGNSNASNTTSKLGTTNTVNLRLYTKNVERMRIDTVGRVGIGTTAPGSKLQVNSASGASPLKVQINASTKLYLSSSGGLSVGSGTGAPSNGLYVSGNVGIGIATPVSGSKLDVEGGSSNFALYAKTTGNYGVYVLAGYMGVYGQGGSYGMYGYGTSTTSYGVLGSGGAYGVYGNSNNSGYGVYGVSSNTSTSSTGVYGTAYYGVKGVGSTGIYGSGITGVHGETASANGSGVFAYASGSYANAIDAYSEHSNGVYGYTYNLGSYAGYFGGDVYTSGSYQASDATLKQNIVDLNSGMAIISQLKPKSYTYRQDGNYKLMNLPSGTRYGLLAQDLEQVMPSLVKASSFNVGRAKQHQIKQQPGKTLNETATQQPAEVIDFKAVNYTELIPIIVKGMQEQEAENKALKAEVAELRQMVLDVKNGNTNTLTLSSASLEQNTPNPVSGTTTIRFHLPENATSGTLNITNAQGQLVKTMTLASGSGQINLNTAALASGTYSYTLYVDGKQVDSKRLLIAR